MQLHEVVGMTLSIGSAAVTAYFWLVRNNRERPRLESHWGGLENVEFASGVPHLMKGGFSEQAGSGVELDAVGAAVIGGVAIFGGSGTVWGAAVGAVLLVTINRALPILGIPDFWQRAVVGGLIIGSIVLDRVLAARRARRGVAGARFAQ